MKVPNTITDKQLRDLQRRAEWAHRRESWTSKKAVKRRLAGIEQRKKANQS